MTTPNIGNQIRTLRKQVGLTQEQLAEKSGTSVNFLSQLERTNSQNVSIKKLDSISTALGIATPELIQRAYSPKGPTPISSKTTYLLNSITKRMDSIPQEKAARIFKIFNAILDEIK